jgi:hypothetical protein
VSLKGQYTLIPKNIFQCCLIVFGWQDCAQAKISKNWLASKGFTFYRLSLVPSSLRCHEIPFDSERYRKSSIKRQIQTGNTKSPARGCVSEARLLLIVQLPKGFRGVWLSNSSSPRRTTRRIPLFRKLNFNRFLAGE